MYFFAIFISALVFGIIAEAIGKEKTKSAFWWGFWLGAIGLIIVVCMPKQEQEDNYARLEKLKDLKNKNVITEEEFNTQKSQILQIAENKELSNREKELAKEYYNKLIKLQELKEKEVITEKEFELEKLKIKPPFIYDLEENEQESINEEELEEVDNKVCKKCGAELSEEDYVFMGYCEVCFLKYEKDKV